MPSLGTELFIVKVINLERPVISDLMDGVRIPKNAKRVFHGMRVNVYHARIKLLNGTYKTFEMTQRPDSVVVIPVFGKKIMAINEWYPISRRWVRCLPAGAVDEGERPKEAARRELQEETGLFSNDIELLFHAGTSKSMQGEDYVFIAKNCVMKEKINHDPAEEIKPFPVNFDRFIKLARMSLNGNAGKSFYELTNTPAKQKSLRKKLFS